MGALAPVKPAEGIKLEVFASVPAWAFAFAVKDGSCLPLFRSGEVAVVEDASGIIPEDGSLYIIEYESRPNWGAHLDPPPQVWRSQEMVQVNERQRRDGSTFWTCDAYARPRTEAQRLMQEKLSGVIVCSDGPYPDEYAVAHKLLGKVIGIYSPSLAAAAPAPVRIA